MGLGVLLGQGHQDRLQHLQCKGRGHRHQARLPGALPATARPRAIQHFYEWKTLGPKEKQPYAIALKNGPLMGMAGLWDTWRSPAGETVRSFTIITCPPNELVGQLHNRMPVILRSEGWPEWLGEEPADAERLKALLVPYPADQMALWPVDKRVGNVRNNDPGLIEPIPLAPSASEPNQGDAPVKSL